MANNVTVSITSALQVQGGFFDLYGIECAVLKSSALIGNRFELMHTGSSVLDFTGLVTVRAGCVQQLTIERNSLLIRCGFQCIRNL